MGDPGNDVLVSAAFATEVVTRHRLGKLPQAAPLAQDFESVVKREGFLPLSSSLRHATLAGSLQMAHKDPFERLPIAQSLAEDVPLVSIERLFDAFEVVRLWSRDRR